MKPVQLCRLVGSVMLALALALFLRSMKPDEAAHELKARQTTIERFPETYDGATEVLLGSMELPTKPAPTDAEARLELERDLYKFQHGLEAPVLRQQSQAHRLRSRLLMVGSAALGFVGGACLLYGRLRRSPDA